MRYFSEKEAAKSEEKKHQVADIVEGPVSASKHDGHGKRIYVFGDWHGRRDKPCDEEIKSARKYQRFDQYLDEVLKANKDQIIDLFLEAEYFGSEEEKTVGYIQDIVTHYAPCSRGRKCTEYPNLRIHLIDLRPTYTLEIINAGSAAKSLLEEKVFVNGDAWQQISDLNDIIKEEKKESAADVALFLRLHEGRANEKLNRQFANLTNPDVAIYALTHFAQQPVNYVALAQLLIASPTFINEEKKMTAPLREGLRELVKFADNLNNLMEQYALVRLFRRWPDRPPVQNAIVFEGEFHANRLRNALKSIGMPAKPLLTQANKGQENLPTLRCLNLSVFPFPLFGA